MISGNGVAEVLDGLVRQGASGLLEVAGNPSGVIYLDAGEITFAQASWVPDLADRLAEVAGSPDQVRALLLDGAGNGLDVGALLMRDGSLSRTALKAVLRSVVIDSLIVLTMPLGDETSVSATSFQPSATHWARGYCRLKANSMRAVAAKRSSGLARCGLAVNTRLELRDLVQPGAVLSNEHWAVASRIDGNLSIRDLASECGIPLYDAIDRVCYLSRKGLCAAGGTQAEPREPGAGSPPVAEPPPAFTSQTTVARKKPRHEPMARRMPVTAGAPAGVLADAMRTAGPSQPPTTDQLRRVLEGLRRLS